MYKQGVVLEVIHIKWNFMLWFLFLTTQDFSFHKQLTEVKFAVLVSFWQILPLDALGFLLPFLKSYPG